MDHANTVDTVTLFISGVSVLLLLGITAAMVYFVFKYHRKKGHKPVDIHGSIVLETIWIVIPTILVLFMFYFGYEGYSKNTYIPEDAYYIGAKAKMWAWEFNYENSKQDDTLYVPVDRTIVLEMESYDVNHALWIPAFRVKKDVIAGKVNYLVFTTDEVGQYDIACAEYCGLEHSKMYSAVKVLSANDFNNWLSAGMEDSEAEEVDTKENLETEKE